MTSSRPGKGSSGPRMRHCPICHKAFLAENSAALPFCSPRCKTIDLGRWLGEDYTVPGDPVDEDEEEGSGLDDYSAGF